MTLRLTTDEDESLTRLAKAYNTSKNHAAAAAIEFAAPRPSHPLFVEATTRRLLDRYAVLMERLAEA